MGQIEHYHNQSGADFSVAKHERVGWAGTHDTPGGPLTTVHFQRHGLSNLRRNRDGALRDPAVNG